MELPPKSAARRADRHPWRRIAIGIVLVILLLFVALAAAPWGFIARQAAGPLQRALGRSVEIGRAERIDRFSLNPTVAIEQVVIGQPHGFGAEPMARIARIEIGFAALPLLIGRFDPESIGVRGARILLLRNRDGRSNWKTGTGDESGGSTPTLDRIAVRDSTFRLIDRRRRIALDAGIEADRVNGIRVNGHGSHRGVPLTVRIGVDGARAAPAAPLRRVHLAARSSLAQLSGVAMLDRAFDTRRFTADITGGGSDLTYLDDFIQAGLFPTRPFRLSARVRHDPDQWRVPRLTGRIGRTELAATLLVRKREGRTRLTGRIDAGQLDFDDFSSAADRLRAAVRRRETGPRVIPATPIRLDRIGKLDGSLEIAAHRLLSAGPSAFRSLRATVALDDRRLMVSGIVAGLRSGTLRGGATIDHRGVVPKLTLDLRLGDARIERLLLPGDAIEGPLRARVRLTGSGATVRDALARADGRIGLVMPGGSVRRDYAIFAGGDVLKSVGTIIEGNDGRRVALRCLIGDFVVRRGAMEPRPLQIDTQIARLDGSGRILLGSEQIDLALAGRARDPGLLQSTAPVRVGGTLSDPKLDVRPPRAENKGKSGVFARIGFFLKGIRTRDKVPTADAAPIDCAGLQAKAMR